MSWSLTKIDQPEASIAWSDPVHKFICTILCMNLCTNSWCGGRVSCHFPCEVESPQFQSGPLTCGDKEPNKGVQTHVRTYVQTDRQTYIQTYEQKRKIIHLVKIASAPGPDHLMLNWNILE